MNLFRFFATREKYNTYCRIPLHHTLTLALNIARAQLGWGEG